MVHISASELTVALTRTPMPGVVSVYLFGSHAAGRAHRESDLDLGVLLDRTTHPSSRSRFDARLALLASWHSAVGPSAIDLVILNDAPPHLARRVLTEGVRVYCADPEQDHAARRTAMLRAADLEPFLRRMRAIKLQAIAR